MRSFPSASVTSGNVFSRAFDARRGLSTQRLAERRCQSSQQRMGSYSARHSVVSGPPLQIAVTVRSAKRTLASRASGWCQREQRLAYPWESPLVSAPGWPWRGSHRWCRPQGGSGRGVGGGPGGPCWMQYSGRIKSQVLKLKNIHWPLVSPLAPIVPVSLAALEPQSTQLLVLMRPVPPMLFVPVQTTVEGGVASCSHLY